jgi:hypothetical protein
MGKYITNRIDFSAILPADYPATGFFIIGLDIADDVYKKMDSLGNITIIGGSSGAASLYHIPVGTTVTVDADHEYFMYGDVLLEGVIVNYGKVVIVNGNLNILGGVFDNFGSYVNTNLAREANLKTINGNSLIGTGDLAIGAGLIDITHASLLALKNGNAMSAGTYYRITDYRTIYDQPDYGDANYISITIASGIFQVGETVTGSISGATGVVKNTDGTTYIALYGPNVGAFQIGDTLTGGTSFAIANADGTNIYVDQKLAVTTKTSVVEPLVVFALSSSKLSAEAFSETYPKDRIRYDIDWVSTEIMGVAAKGRITERIDEGNNRTPYDQRTVLFKRYDNGSGVFNVYNDNGNASAEFTTFTLANNVNFTITSGSFQVGDIVTGSISLATGTVVETDGTSYMYVTGNNVIGFIFGDILTGSISLAIGSATYMTGFYSSDNYIGNTLYETNLDPGIFILSNNVMGYSAVACTLKGMSGKTMNCTLANGSTTIQLIDSQTVTLGANNNDIKIINGLELGIGTQNARIVLPNPQGYNYNMFNNCSDLTFGINATGTYDSCNNTKFGDNTSTLGSGLYYANNSTYGHGNQLGNAQLATIDSMQVGNNNILSALCGRGHIIGNNNTVYAYFHVNNCVVGNYNANVIFNGTGNSRVGNGNTGTITDNSWSNIVGNDNTSVITFGAESNTVGNKNNGSTITILGNRNKIGDGNTLIDIYTSADDNIIGNSNAAVHLAASVTKTVIGDGNNYVQLGVVHGSGTHTGNKIGNNNTSIICGTTSGGFNYNTIGDNNGTISIPQGSNVIYNEIGDNNTTVTLGSSTGNIRRIKIGDSNSSIVMSAFSIGIADWVIGSNNTLNITGGSGTGTNNRIGNYNTLTILSSSSANDFGDGNSVSLISGSTGFINNKFEHSTLSGQDFSVGATLVYASYSKTIYTDSAGTTKLRYYNSSDVMVIAGVTD